MKRFTTSLILVVLTTAVLSLNSTVFAQGQPDNVPHRVGLIDMGHIFKNYKRVEDLLKDLKAEVSKTDQQAKSMANTIKQKSEQLKQLKEGTPAYTNLERQLAQEAANFETFRKVAQRDFLRKEAQIYRTVYLEVAEAVEKYAEYYKYTLVIRFNRDGVDDTQKTAEVVNRMNRQIIYHREEDDITTSILDYLNRRYQPSSGGTPAAKGN